MKTLTEIAIECGVFMPKSESGLTTKLIIDEAQLQSFVDAVNARDSEPDAINERNKLGYAVVDVIGKLDEIVDVADEVEVDDLLHKAIPIDLWNELQEALENMPARAEFFTAPQPDQSAYIKRLEDALIRLRDCDWVITPRDRMDAVRDIARDALTSKESIDG